MQRRTLGRSWVSALDVSPFAQGHFDYDWFGQFWGAVRLLLGGSWADLGGSCGCLGPSLVQFRALVTSWDVCLA